MMSRNAVKGEPGKVNASFPPKPSITPIAECRAVGHSEIVISTADGMEQNELNTYANRLIDGIGLNQSELSRLSGKSRTYINEVINGSGNASLSFVRHLELLLTRGPSIDVGEIGPQILNELASVPAAVRETVGEQTIQYLRMLKLAYANGSRGFATVASATQTRR